MGDYVPMTLGRRAYVVAALQTVLRMERSPANKCIMDNMRAKYKGSGFDSDEANKLGTLLRHNRESQQHPIPRRR